MAGWWAETLTAPEPANTTLTGGTPNVTATQHKTITPSAANLHITGGQPAPAGYVATPTTATIATTGGTPTLKQDRNLTPTAATTTTTGGTPSVIKNTILTPTPKATTITGGTPTITNASPVAYNTTGTPSSSFAGDMTYSFTAASGADVFVAANWDRSGGGINGITYGGVAMTLVATLTHNNTSGSGGVAVYRLAGGGNGSSKNVVVDTFGGAWFISNAISFTSVSSVASAVTAFGSSATASQSLTVSSGIVLQVVSSANGGSGVGDYTSFSGVTNRWHQVGTGGAMALNTVTATGTASSTSSGSQPWAAISVPLT